MRNGKYQWQYPEPQEVSAEFQEEINERNLPEHIAKLLWQRNIRSKDELRRFLDPQLTDFHNPFLMQDMDKVVSRIQQAVAAGEKILVYGDYDADGITSATVMKEAIELIGGDVEVYLPNRFTDGYGPNQSVYQYFIDSGIQLIVTVDNGVSGHEAIDYANSRGVDVLVTDHHELPETLPDAYGIIHPRHPQGQYPFGDLAGVGVAFKVACALLDEVPLEFLDLVAIGTIADLVSLTGENRALVTIGLQLMKQTERLGLIELFKAADAKLAQVDETMIGFSISPRLNAIGRLKDPNPAVTLLTTFDEEEARSLAQELNQINEERKALVTKITKEAESMIDPNSLINVVAAPNWHEGVLGIVAGRLVQLTGKPSLVLTIKDDGIAKGSGRSVTAVNLFSLLSEEKERFVSFGGHHMAVGLSVPASELTDLQAVLTAKLHVYEIDVTTGEPLAIDEVLTPEQVTLELVEQLSHLAPFGTDNKAPVFAIKGDQTPVLRQLGAEQQHLKLSIAQKSNPATLDVIGFSFGSEITEFTGDPFTLVGQLTINEWNGLKKPQLQLLDFAVEGLQVFDLRGQNKRRHFTPKSDTLLLAFGPVKAKKQPVVTYENTEQLTAVLQAGNYQEVAFLDCPEDPEKVKTVVQVSGLQRILLILEAKDEAYLDGMGTREQYARLFKLINGQEKLVVRYKLPEIAQFLKIPQNLLIFMIQVFFDLEFVTIEDGVLQKATVSQKKNLEESQVYQKRLKKIKSEEFLLLSDLAKMKAWLSA